MSAARLAELDSAKPIDRLRGIMHILRNPGGCPWDMEQTHESLVPNLIEEAWEAAAAIRSGDAEHMKEELGDCLLQVVFHGEMASETGAFDFDQICDGISDKLVRRHPHVFGDSDVTTTDGVLQQWDEIKAEEKGGSTATEKPYLHNVGEGLPALLRAQELQKRAAKVGFDWPTAKGAMEKLKEELGEMEAEIASGDKVALEEEFGDLLFSIVNVGRKLGLHAETELGAACQKFQDRFGKMEKALIGRGDSLEGASLEEMDAEWDVVKLA